MNTSLSARLTALAPLAVRLSVGLVLLWFSVNQLIDPRPWSSIVPPYVTGLTGLSAVNIVMANAIFEFLLALVLLSGMVARWAGLVASLHIFQIALMLGYNAIGVRDFGLAMAALAIFLHGEDGYSVGRLFRNKK